MQKLKIGVIFGGMSTEHDVSMVSGTSVIKNLNKEKYDISPIYIDEKGEWYIYTKDVKEIEILKVGDKIEELQKIQNVMQHLRDLDVVFPVLHGLYGEDGPIQGLLELLNKKYVGCKVLASSVCMDKVYAKVIFDKAKIEQAKYIYIRENKDKYIYVDKEFNEEICDIDIICEIVEKNIGYPVFVKPSNSGSSVGINKSCNKNELINHIKYASKFDKKILIEQSIKGREIECAVLGNEDVKASILGEVLSAEEFYTFDAKYKNNESRTVMPADLPESVSNKVREIAKKAFKAVDGKGLSRVDFFIEESTGRIIINEINTLPGFTQISMYPKLWEQMGLSYSELLEELIKLAME